MRHLRIAAWTACIASLCLSATVLAAPLGTMTLEGQLLTVAGSPVPDGDYTLKVSFYKDKQELKALHSETAQIKLISGGFVFTVGLAQPLKADIFTSGDAAWVGIQVGSEQELPRLPLNHVAYAFSAESANALACTGCLKTEHLDKSVLEPFALKSDLKFAGADQKCPDGEHMVSFDAAGKVVCAKAPVYSGQDFALSKQSCPLGELVAGVDDAGKVVCAKDGGATYDGKNFAVSGQACPKGQVASAVDGDGKLTCVEIKVMTYSGKDFALSDQKCGAGKVMQDIGPDGKISCVANPSAVLKGEQVNNLAANKLANGSAPWTDPKAHAHGYDVDSAWLHDAKDDANVKLYGNKRQLVMRTDGSDEYNKGVGAYPFVWMFGGDVALNRVMALDEKGQLWTSGYGWLHERFAATKTQCSAGMVMRGVLADGKPDCVKDLDTKTIYKAADGVALNGDTFSADVTFLDKRYVNEMQKDSITSPMIIDGQVVKADLGANSVDSSKVVDGSLTGSDVANESLTGTDIKNGSIASADIADGSVTGADVANASLTGADIKDGALTGDDIGDSTLTGADILNSSLTGADIKDKSLTASDVDPASVQVRVGGTCPDGQAIRAIGADGKVTCVTDTGADFVKYAGAVKTGRWYRIASSANAAQVAGTFHIYDATYGGTMTIRVGIAKGSENTMDVALLHNSHAGTPVFSQMRVLEGSNSQAHYVELRADKDASVWFYLGDNNHVQSWSADSWVDRGTAGTVAGWGNRFYELDKLLMIGGVDDRLSVGRDGITQVQTAGGNVQIGAKDANYTHFVTDRPAYYFNKRLRVDEGIISSHSQNLTFQTSGTTRGYFNNSNGWFYTNLGASLCASNPSGCGLTISDDGGFYDQNDGWIRNQVSLGLLIRDKSDKDWRDLQARHVTAHGNLHTSGTFNSNGAATLKSSLTVNGTATVANTLAANNGITVDGQTVIDNGAGWHRTVGSTGWYNETHKGGIYMEDASWVRVYGGKNFLVPGNAVARADGGFQVDGQQVIDGAGGWHTSYGKAGWSNATYGGGIYMEDTSWVRVSGTKHFLVAGDRVVRADGGFQVDGNQVIDNDAGWHRSWGNTGWYSSTHGGGIYMDQANYVRVYNNKGFTAMGRVGVGTASPAHPLHVAIADANWQARFENKASVYLSNGGNYGIHVNTYDASSTKYALQLHNNAKVLFEVRNNGTVYIGGQTLSDYIRDVVNSRCYIYFGWRDSCDGCASYSKIVRSRGDDTCQSSGVGGTSCWQTTPWGQSVKLAGFDTDGDVNGDDKFWVGFKCF